MDEQRMPELRVADAFRSFDRLAARFALASETAETAGGRVAHVARTGAELRLAWNADDERLVLQITHGPPDGEPAGWLELFAAPCPAGILPLTAEPELLSALEHGFELMAPAGGDRGS